MPQIASEIIDIYEITEGLNTVKSGIRITSNELKDCQNIRYFPIGGFMWRQGYTTFGDNPGQACTGLYMGRFSSNTNFAFRTRGSKVEYMASMNGTWTDITNSVTLTSGQNNLFSFDILNDIVIGVNGVDNAIQISSAPLTTTVGALPGSVIPTYVYQHRGYMWYVTADKVFFSDLNTPATVGANNYVQSGSKQGGANIAGVDYAGRNFVFKRHGIYAVDFQPTQVDSSGTLFPFTSNPVSLVAGVGTQSPKSLVKFTTPITHKSPGQELVFFVDQFGVPRLFDGQVTTAIGASILTSRDSTITSLANMDRTRLPYVWAVNDTANNLIQVFMSSTGQTKHDVCWVLDYRSSFAWCRDSYVDTFNAGAIFENTNGTFTPYFGTYTGQVMKMNSTQTDNGGAITSYARTGDMFINRVAVRSKWIYNEIRGTAGSDTQSLSVSYYEDGQDSPSVATSVILYKQNQSTWDDVNWDEFNYVYDGLTTTSSEINLETKTLGVKFSNSTSGNTATIEGFSLFGIPEGWKQE